MGIERTPIIIAISGASGSIYGLTIAKKILNQNIPIHLIISTTADTVILDETGFTIDSWIEKLKTIGDVFLEKTDNFASKVSSGSYITRGMIIAPCSMGTLGRIASGISSSLIDRAADVTIKERRKLVIVARETPLSLIHLENMTKLTQAGAVIMPPVPAFYSSPKTIDDIINNTSDRVLSIFNIYPKGSFHWSGIKEHKND